MKDKTSKKIYPLRKKRERIRKRNLTILSILVMTGLCVAAYAVLQMEGWKVKVMEVKGTERVDPEKIYRASKIQVGDNMLFSSVSRIERGLSRVPLVKDVKVARVYPSKIVIAVEERRPFAYLVNSGRYYLVDEERTLLESAVVEPKRPLMRVEVDSLRAGRTGETVEFYGSGNFRGVCEAFRTNLGGKAKTVRFARSGIKIFMEDGFFVLLGRGGNVEEKLALVPVLMESARELGEKISGLNLKSLDSPSFVR